MALATYSDLKAAVASWANRADLTANIPDFIALAEVDMQRRCKLLEFEGAATVTITDGSGALPTDFAGMRSIYWDGDEDYPLTYVAPEKFDALRESGLTDDAWVYTISGGTIRTYPQGSGSVVLTYNAKFTALSDSNTSNALLTNHPDVYLFGACKQAAIFTKDTAGIGNYGALMDQAVAGVRINNDDRKYAGPLRVLAR